MQSELQIRTQIADPKTGCTFLVRAWRPLTRAEAVQAVKGFLAARPSLKPSKGDQIIVNTVIGLRD